MQDDGVGIRTIEAMKKRTAFEPHIDLIDGGTAGLDLLPVIGALRKGDLCGRSRRRRVARSKL